MAKNNVDAFLDTILNPQGQSTAYGDSDGVVGYGQEDFTNAVRTGVRGLSESVNRIGAAMGSDAAQTRADAAATESDFYSQAIDAPQRASDIGGLGDLGGYIYQGAGKMLPEMALALVPGGVVGGLARRGALAAGEAAATAASRGALAGRVAGGAAVTPSGIGQALTNQYDQSGEYDLLAAVPLGVGYGVLSAGLGIEGGALAAAGRKGLTELGEGGFKSTVAKGVGMGAAGEGTQELAQDELTNQVARLSVDGEYDYFGEGAMSDRVEAFLGGAILGGAIRGGTDAGKYALKPRRNIEEKTDLLAHDDAPTAQAAPTAPAATDPNNPNFVGPRGEFVPSPVLSEDLSGQTSFLKDFGAPDNGVLIRDAVQEAPEAPFVDTLTGDLFSEQNMMRERPRLPAPAPTTMVVDSEGNVSPQDLVARQNAALDNRLSPPVPGMEGQQGQQPGGEPMETNFTIAQRERPKVLEFLRANRFKPKSKVARLAIKAGTMAALPGALRAAEAEAATDMEAASYERAYMALTGRSMFDDVDVPTEGIVPEGAADLAAQLAAIADPSSAKDTMIVTTGDSVPAALPEGAQAVETAQGTVISTNPAKIAKAQLNAKNMTTSMVGDLLGYKGSKADTDGTIVQARDANDNVVWEQATNAADLDDVAAIAEDMKPKGGRIVASSVEEALAGRTERAQKQVSAPESTALPVAPPTTANESVQSKGVPPLQGDDARPLAASHDSPTRAVKPDGEVVPTVPVPREPQSPLSAEAAEWDSVASEAAKRRVPLREINAAFQSSVGVSPEAYAKRTAALKPLVEATPKKPVPPKRAAMEAKRAAAKAKEDAAAKAKEDAAAKAKEDAAAKERAAVAAKLAANKAAAKAAAAPAVKENLDDLADDAPVKTARGERKIAKELFDERAQDANVTNTPNSAKEVGPRPVMTFESLDVDLQERWLDQPKTAANFREIADAQRTRQRTARASDKVVEGVRKAERNQKERDARQAEADNRAEEGRGTGLTLEQEAARDRAAKEDIMAKLNAKLMKYAKRAPLQTPDIYEDPAFSRDAPGYEGSTTRVNIKDAPAQEWVRTLSKSAVSAPFRALLKRIANSPAFKLLEGTKVRFVDEAKLAEYADDEGGSYKGVYVPAENTIYINQAYAGEETLVHELIHAATLSKIRSDKVLGDKIMALASPMWRRLKRRLKSEGKPFNDAGLTHAEIVTLEAAFASPEELITYWFTSPIFRGLIEKGAPGRMENLIAQALNLFGALKKALGFAIRLPASDTAFMTRMDSRMADLLDLALDDPRYYSGQAPAYARAAFGTPKEVGTDVSTARKGASELLSALAGRPETITAFSKGNQIVRRLMTMGQLVSSYGDKLPALKTFNSLRIQMAERVNELTKLGTNTFKEMRLASRDPENFTKLTDLIYESTMSSFRLDQPADSEGNAQTVQSSTSDLSPEKAAEFKARQDDARQNVKDYYADLISPLQEKAEQAAAEAEFGEKMKARKPYTDQIASLRADEKEALKGVKAKFAAELKEATKEQRAERADNFAKMQARYNALPKTAQKLYTDIFDSYADARDREYRALVALTMRRFGSIEGYETLPKESAAIDALMAKLVLENDPKVAQELVTQMRDLAKGYGRGDVDAFVKDRAAAVVGLRQDLKGGMHAYAPLLRFGDHAVIAKSKAFITLEKKLKDAEANLKAVQASSPIMRKILDAESRLAALDDAKAANGTDNETHTKFIRQAKADINTELRALRKQLKEKKVNADGTVSMSDYSAAMLEVSQLKYEVKQSRRNGDDYSVNFFDGELEAERATQALNKDGLVATRHKREDYSRQLDGVGASIMARLRNDAADGSVEDQALSDMLTQTYLRSLPESNALKRRLKREGVRGFSTDLMRTFAEYHQSHAFFVSRIEYADQMADQLELIRRDAREKGADFEDVYNVVKGQQTVNLVHARTPVTDAFTRMGAFWYLGITPAFLALNMTQNFVLTYPVVAARFGYRDTARELGRGMADVAKMYRTQLKKSDGKEFLEFEVDFNKADLTKGEQVMIETLQAKGLINFTQTVEMVDRRVGTLVDTKTGRAKDALIQLERLGWFLPHHTEVINRGAAALMSYRLAIAKGMTVEAAQEYASSIVAGTHGDYAESNKPLMLRQINRVPGGKLLTLFKSYQQMMVFALMSNARDMFRADLPAEERKVAFKALAGIFGTHAMFAGALGMPGMALVGAAAEMLLGDDDEPFDFNASFRTTMADALGKKGGEIASKGLLRALPVIGQVDFASRVTAGGIFSPVMFSDNPKAEGRDLLGSYAVSAGGPVAGIVANMLEASSRADKGADFVEIMSLITPKAFADIFRAVSLADKGATTRSGVQLYEGDAMDVFGQAMGFRPTKSAESGEMRLASLKLKTALETREANLKNRYARAFKEKDYKAMAEIRKEGREFYKKQPSRGNVTELDDALKAKARTQAGYANGRKVTDDPYLEGLTDFGLVE